MSGSAGQAMPNSFAQPGQMSPGADKGPGQPTQTAMGTPIVYGKSYLDSNQYAKNIQPVVSPLSASNTYVDQGGVGIGSDAGYGSSDSGVSSGDYGAGFAASSASDFGGSDAGSDSGGGGGGGGGK